MMLKQYVRKGERKRKLTTLCMNVIILPLVPFLYPACKLFNLKLIRLRSSRIGHLAGNTELFLRRRNLGILNKKIRIIALATKKPCNEQLLKMIKRRVKVIQIPQPSIARGFTKWLATYSVFRSLDILESLPWDSNAYYEMTYGKPNLSFSTEEEELGQNVLNKLGIVNEPFICFHARDSVYLEGEWKRGDSYHQYRNCSVENYLQAAEYFTNQGGFALRMGAKVSGKLSLKTNFRVIDYATRDRTDFSDIYLPAKCKFFLGNTAGLFLIPTIFNVPVALANLMLLLHPPFRKGDLFIPTKFYSKSEKRILTYREVINSKILFFHSSEEYERAGIEIIENTSEEILDLAVEMNERIDGKWKVIPEDQLLQEKFKSLFPRDAICQGYPSLVGAQFLRKNTHLLE